MHAYRLYVQTQMDERGWDRPELARRSGLSRQQVHRILTDDRDRLPERPDSTTVAALAKAFGGNSERVLWIVIAQAMGLPVLEQRIGDAALLSDDELIRELQRRLSRVPAVQGVETHQPKPIRRAAREARPDTPPTGPDEPTP